MTTSDVIRRYREHSGEVSALDFDGHRVVSGGMDGTVNIYTLGGGEQGGSDKRRRGQPRRFAASAVKFSDAAWLAQEEALISGGGAKGTEGADGATATAARPAAQTPQLVLESLHTKQVTSPYIAPI